MITYLIAHIILLILGSNFDKKIYALRTTWMTRPKKQHAELSRAFVRIGLAIIGSIVNGTNFLTQLLFSLYFN